MITLSLNFNGNATNATRAAQDRVREVIDTHLAFPGSDKLKWGLTIKDNGASSVTFAGPHDIVSEAKRLWKENVGSSTEEVKKTVRKAAKPKAKKVTVK